MNDDSTEVRLAGPWPAGAAEELASLLGERSPVLEEGTTVQRGMLPWAEIGSLVSAAAAAITVGLTLWDRRGAARRPQESRPMDTGELERRVKQQGIFGVAVERVEIDPSQGERAIVRINDENSGRRFQFEITDAETGLHIRIASEEER